MTDSTLHSHESSYREKLIEHLFVAELLKHSWKRAREEGAALIELSRADVDRGGYDLIAEAGGYLRHIQIKGSVRGAKAARQRVHVALGDKPSGCVVWVYLDDEACGRERRGARRAWDWCQPACKSDLEPCALLAATMQKPRPESVHSKGRSPPGHRACG